MVGGRRDRDEAVDFRTTHQQLEADIRPEGGACDPALARAFAQGFKVIKDIGGVGELRDAGIELPLAASDTPEIEAHGRKTVGREHLEQRDRDRVLHRSARLGVRMKDQGDRRIGSFGRRVSGFDPARRARNDQFRHGVLAVLRPRKTRKRPGRRAEKRHSVDFFKFFVR